MALFEFPAPPETPAERKLRGEVRGGRFVAGWDGEQYALPRSICLNRISLIEQDAAGQPWKVLQELALEDADPDAQPCT